MWAGSQCHKWDHQWLPGTGGPCRTAFGSWKSWVSYWRPPYRDALFNTCRSICEVTQVQLRGITQMLMCQMDAIHSPVHPLFHKEKDIESPSRRAKQWAALIAAPENVTGQDFPSWASAAAQHIDPKLVQMRGAPAAPWCCFLKGRSSSSLVCCDGEALLWAQALHARRGAVTNNLNVDSCSFMSYTQWQISFEHPLHPYQATTGLALRPTEHPLSFLKCIFIKIPTFALGLLWMLMPSSLFLQNKLFVISQVLFFSEHAICKWISFTFSLKCFCAGISKWKNFGKTIFWSASRKQKITWSYFELLLCIKWLKCLKLEFLKVLLTVEREKYIK